MKISGAKDISERYFVINAFDGAMTMLGATVGAYMAGSIDPKLMVGVGLGASLALGVSGFSGAYLTEKAMREREIKELEKAMFTNLENTIIGNASRVAVIWVALINGISPALAATASIFPFILALMGLITKMTAVIASLISAVVVLFVLGAYLGKVSKGNVLIFGLHTALAGVVTAVLCIAIGGL
ncbi:TPA: hypothetical protein EYP44_02500 [Candidatus Bathyarchaeota archaeon]|nr:hypothetical protein [Candidatus Bathyarchaeota archaeon]